jgi:ABC-2 type transport system permease protein/sodium transport system permease protein
MSDPAGNDPVHPRADPARLLRLARKELSEILRDRRTVITLFLMPLLLYPLLSVAFRQYLLANQPAAPGEEKKLVLGPASEEVRRDFGNELVVGWNVLGSEARAKGPVGGRPPLWWREEPVPNGDVRGAVLRGECDLGVRFARGVGRGSVQPAPGPLDCELFYLKGSSRGREALKLVRRLLAAAQRGHLQKLLGRTGAVPGVVVLRPTAVEVSDAEASPRSLLAPVIPLILILMTITGAVYPAIDLTAGERERGTLEILMAAPVPRLGLVFAKYVTVLTVAVLTALVNLTTMFVTIRLSGLAPLVFPDGGPTLLLMAELFALLLLFAAFFSAVLLALTSFARSFKEAQAYLIPLMLASLGPGLLAILPGMELSGLSTVVPLFNIVLLARDLLEPRAVSPAAAGLVVGSTLLYAAAAVAGAARVFGSEGVLYNEQSTWSDLLRRPAEPHPTPGLAGALLCLALLFPASFFLQSALAGALGPEPTAAHLLAMAGLGALLFGAVPVGLVVWRRVPPGSGLLLRSASWVAWVAAVLLGLSLWPLVLEIPPALERLGLVPMDREALGRVAERLASQPLWLVAAVLAAQGVFEELFFRGYLFSALRSAGGGAAAVGVSALLFGLFHLVADGFAVDRWLISTLLGLVLGWLCLRSGSVLPGMLLHACHNGVLAALPYYQRDLGLTEAEVAAGLLPVPWLLAAAAGVAVGLGLLVLARRPFSTPAGPAGA